jgi:hypothetical protein
MKKLREMGYDSPLVESREQFLELMAKKGVRCRGKQTMV